jgi:hypothetical protein
MNATATLSKVSDPEPCVQVPDEAEEKRVPEEARLWGFVRRTANERDDGASLKETDVALWLDENCYRFLVAAGRSVKDDLAPLEFVQFIRELRHSRSQTLFKLGNSFVRSPPRATVVWPRPLAPVLPFPMKRPFPVRAAARPNQSGAEHHGKSDGAAVMMPAVHRTSPRTPRGRIGNAAAARFS